MGVSIRDVSFTNVLNMGLSLKVQVLSSNLLKYEGKFFFFFFNFVGTTVLTKPYLPLPLFKIIFGFNLLNLTQ